VLCGFEVPAEQRGELLARFARLGFEWVDETNNPAARLFLR
jgi:hypothetical protein